MFKFSKKNPERQAAREAKWNALTSSATIFRVNQ